MTKIEAKETTEKLAERFDYHIDGYKKGNFNETQTRTDYINPLFEALGWDINNKAGLAESYREVIHEDKIKISGSTKAPDYCFTVYGQKKFFLEAKKPSVLVKEAIDPAYQIRRYGWSAKMPISIISDFEEFAIYDCTIKPSPTDKASVSRIKYITFKDYIKEFDFLWDTFSKEMVLKGSFDKFVSSNKGKKGTSGVDAEFLKSLDSWRDLLARNIVNRNTGITEDELNYSLQKVIDRIIFLRICEDRGVELENQLFKSIGTNTYQNLKVLFHSADLKYNSGLFDYKKDNITDNLNIDDKILKTIIEEMYYPKSPYEFSVLPVEILGHSYEQYLGKVIKITPGHRIKIEEKPEVRKAGGVYYTPQYIVDYIVKNTVGKLIGGKSPEDVAKIKICDPACGSGSFLLGAYQYLLDWHMQYYMNEPATGRFSGGHHPNLTPDGNLTTAIKKKILINNIYGVDIDTNAVEVTKLSLMLKAMEGETEASISQLSFLHERVLPTLDNNIKSGNSLIDIDFYDSQIDFEPGAEKKIKPFNWQNAFPEVFKQGGFDVVIGNPPYVEIQKLQSIYPLECSYFRNTYQSAKDSNIDIYVIFIQKGLELLNKNGLLGFICPNRFFTSDYGFNIRAYLLNYNIYKLLNFRHYFVFENANTYTTLLFLKNEKQSETIEYLEFNKLYKTDNIIASNIVSSVGHDNLKIDIINAEIKNKRYWYFMTNKDRNLETKLISNNTPFSEIYENNFVGIQTSKDDFYILKLISKSEHTSIFYSKYLGRNIEIENTIMLHIIADPNIKKYRIDDSENNYILFPYEHNGKIIEQKYLAENYPKAWGYLNAGKKDLQNRENGKMNNNYWYTYVYAKNIDKQKYIKLLIPHVVKEMRCAYDIEGSYAIKNVGVNGITLKNNINESPLYIMAILNNSISTFIISKVSIFLSGGFYAANKQFASKIPIKMIDFTNSKEKDKHDTIVKYVDQMLQLNKDLQNASLPEQKEQLQARIKYTDKKIDQLVYQLYELSEEEIKIVEGEV